MFPLILELKKIGDLKVKIMLTGQHRDMVGGVMRAFGITPDYDLQVMRIGQTLFDLSSDILKGAEPVLTECMPDIVFVEGDTASAYFGALSAFYLGIPIAHIEAGLRSYDIREPFPEEAYRIFISDIAAYNFAPTEMSYNNLIKEGRRSAYLVGNTVCDALRLTEGLGRSYASRDKRTVLLTTHRRENQGERQISIFRAAKMIARSHPEIEIIYPVHKNPKIRLLADKMLGDIPGITMTEPLGVFDFHSTLRDSYMVLTDSGGVAEESAALGVPSLILRDKSERMEAIDCGASLLASTECEKIFSLFESVFEKESVYYKMRTAKNPFGDGYASKRIADILFK